MAKPNILIFMTDQQRACSVLPGDPYKAITPVLDEFRKDSITFSRTFCPSPHCCPSRASFMTGLMPTQHGVWHNVAVSNAITRGLKAHVRPWSVDMKEAGYQMRYVGKWHVSNYQMPEHYGWNEAITEPPIADIDGQNEKARRGEINGVRNRFIADPGTERGRGEILRPGYPKYVHYGINEDPFSDQKQVDSGVAALEGMSRDAPWCLYVGTLGPHDTYHVPQRFLDMYADAEFALPETFDDPMDDKPALYRRTRDRFSQLTPDEHREAIKHYLAFCTYEDWLFGQLVEKLKARGEWDNTIVLYVSDHGDYMGDHGLWTKGLPAFLSGYHVPAIMKVPGTDGSVVRDELVSLCDFGPTFLELTGVESPVDFAGQSLLPLLKSDSCPLAAEDWRDALFFQTNGNETYGIQRSILTDTWRFVFNAFDYDELYDLESDPGQMTNLLARRRPARRDDGRASDPGHETVKREMYSRIWDFGLAHEEPVINGYITTAMADYGPGVATGPAEQGR